MDCSKVTVRPWGLSLPLKEAECHVPHRSESLPVVFLVIDRVRGQGWTASVLRAERDKMEERQEEDTIDGWDGQKKQEKRHKVQTEGWKEKSFTFCQFTHKGGLHGSKLSCPNPKRPGNVRPGTETDPSIAGPEPELDPSVIWRLGLGPCRILKNSLCFCDGSFVMAANVSIANLHYLCSLGYSAPPCGHRCSLSTWLLSDLLDSTCVWM